MFTFLSKVSSKSLFEAFFTIGGRLLSVFLVIASTKFLTNFLSEVDYGKLALYNITATLPNQFFFAPLGQGILRYYPIAREKSELKLFDQQFTSLFWYGAIVTIFLGLIAAIFCFFVGQLDWALAFVLIATLNVFNSINAYRYGLQNAARKRVIALGLETGDRVLQQVLAILLLWLVSGNPLIALLGYAISAIVFFFANDFFYRKTFSLQPAHDENKKHPEHSSIYKIDLLQYAWPFILFGIFFWFQNASERWALEILRPPEELGHYAIINQIGFQSFTLLFGSISYFFTPILFNRAGGMNNAAQIGSADRLNNQYLRLNLVFTAVLCIVFWLFAPQILQLLSNERYVALSYLLPLMALAGGLFNYGQIYANRFMVTLRSKSLLIPRILTSIFGVVTNFIAVYWGGVNGLVIGVMVTQLVYILLLHKAWQHIATDFIQDQNKI